MISANLLHSVHPHRVLRRELGLEREASIRLHRPAKAIRRESWGGLWFLLEESLQHGAIILCKRAWICNYQVLWNFQVDTIRGGFLINRFR